MDHLPPLTPAQRSALHAAARARAMELRREFVNNAIDAVLAAPGRWLNRLRTASSAAPRQGRTA